MGVEEAKPLALSVSVVGSPGPQANPLVKDVALADFKTREVESFAVNAREGPISRTITQQIVTSVPQEDTLRARGASCVAPVIRTVLLPRKVEFSAINVLLLH